MKSILELYEASILGDIDTTISKSDSYMEKLKKAESILDELNAVCDNDGVSFENNEKNVCWRYYTDGIELLQILNIKTKSHSGKILIKIVRIKALDEWEITISGAEDQFNAFASMFVDMSAAKTFKALMRKLTKDKVFTDLESFKKTFSIKQ